MNTVLIIDRLIPLVRISLQSENVNLGKTRPDDVSNSAVKPVPIDRVSGPELEPPGLA